MSYTQVVNLPNGETATFTGRNGSYYIGFVRVKGKTVSGTRIGVYFTPTTGSINEHLVQSRTAQGEVVETRG